MANKLWSSVWKGEYSGSTAYTVGDFVTYQGSCYTCVQNSTGNLPTNTTYWKLVAQKGDTGATGPQGDTGATGAQGNKGGLRYNFSTDTADSDPGQGVFKYNNATISSVTQIFIDLLDQGGVDFTSFIDSWDDSTSTVKGYLIILSNDNSDTTVNIWQISSVTSATGYRKIGVTYISGSLPSNNEACVINFYRTGDKGQDGMGSGDVVGPSSSTNNDIVLFDGTTGKLIKDSGKGLPSGAVVGDTDVQTLTNKRINPRVQSVTSASTITPNADNDDMVDVTALAVNATIAAPSGTPVNGQKLIIRIKDNGTSRTLTWNSAYVNAGGTLPTATTAGKVHHVGLIYNSNTSQWMCVAAVVQS